MMMGFIILFSSVLSVVVFIPGQSGLIWKTRVPTETTKTTTKTVGSVAIEQGDSPKLASGSVTSKQSESSETDSDHRSHHSDSDADPTL